MSKKYRWLKLTGLLLLVVLFFLIINSFSRENNRLLAERNMWAEKAKALAESNQKLQNENRELQQVLDQGRPGLIIKTLDLTTLGFKAPNRLTYQLTITVANRSDQSVPAGGGGLFFALRQPGTDTYGRTSWRRIQLPSFQPGEVKTLPVTGELAADPREELLLLASFDQQPGVAKVEVRLPDVTTAEVLE